MYWAVGLGVAAKMVLINNNNSIDLHLFIDGSIESVLPSGNTKTLKVDTTYPVSGDVKMSLSLDRQEQFELRIRMPSWSKNTNLFINGKAVPVCAGYVYLDMRTEYLKPISYGNQILMTHVVWGSNYTIPSYDEENPIARNHCALRRGPITNPYNDTACP